MKIERTTKELNAVKKGIREYLKAEEKKGIHLTHLYIPLKSYFLLKYPEEEITDNEMLYFITGKGYHAVIEALQEVGEDTEFGRYLGAEVELRYKGLFVYTVDLLYYSAEHMLIPVEIKTTRLQDISEKYIPDTYLFQLRGYISLLNETGDYGIGYLVVISVTKPSIVVFKVEMDKKEMEQVRRDLEERAILLRRAIEDSNPNLLLRYGKIPRWASHELLKTHGKYGVKEYISPFD